MVDFREMPYERPDMDALRRCYEAAIDALRRAQVDSMSPLEALNLLYELKQML